MKIFLKNANTATKPNLKICPIDQNNCSCSPNPGAPPVITVIRRPPLRDRCPNGLSPLP
jgi:hypothetical protein